VSQHGLRDLVRKLSPAHLQPVAARRMRSQPHHHVKRSSRVTTQPGKLRLLEMNHAHTLVRESVERVTARVQEALGAASSTSARSATARRASYRASAGTSAASSPMPATHASPPETTETRGVNTVAAAPDSRSPSRGPPATT